MAPLAVRRTHAEFVGSTHLPHRIVLACLLEYDPGEPLEVLVTLFGNNGPILLHVSRDLLLATMAGEVGEAWRGGLTYQLGRLAREGLLIGLHLREQSEDWSTFAVPERDVTGFLAETLRLVPTGDEVSPWRLSEGLAKLLGP